jgi:hypothetical protein
METTIKLVIEMYVKYISEQNINGLNYILHPHFRVTQVIPATFETLNLSKAAYLQLFSDNKAGGDEYEIEDLSIQYIGPTAAASYTLHGKQTHMHVFLQLGQTSDTTWSILSNTPMVTACAH